MFQAPQLLQQQVGQVYVPTVPSHQPSDTIPCCCCCRCDAVLTCVVQSVLDKYLEPAKSLQEAAHRAWLPIGSSRSLVFDRRQQKAAAVRAVTQQQLLDWYDQHVHPAGSRHHALCVQEWGGAAAAPATAVEAAAAAAALQGPGSSGGVVSAQQVASFKQRQALLPLPTMQLPPTNRAAV